MLHGPSPTLIGRSAVAGLVARSMGVTVLELKLLTYAVAPLGEMAIAAGPLPTLIGVPSEKDDDRDVNRRHRVAVRVRDVGGVTVGRDGDTRAGRSSPAALRERRWCANSRCRSRSPS